MRNAIVSSLLFGSAVLALPSPAAGPSKPFIIGVTVPGVPTYYLGKAGDGYGTTNLADAQTCIVDEKTQLVCGKDTAGRDVIVGAMSFLQDMVPLKANWPQDITTGFSLDEKNVLHWRNDKFSLIEEMKKNQGGEAKWALYPDNDKKRYQLYAQLGCPNNAGEVHGFHQGMVPGELKIVVP